MVSGAAVVTVIVVSACLLLIGGFIAVLGWIISLSVQTIRELATLALRLRRDDSLDVLGLGPYARAEALMREMLSDDEFRQLTRYGYVDFASPSRADRIYRVPRFLGRVTVYEQGVAMQSLCVQPSQATPGPDVIVMHKLMILGDEATYLANANRFPPMIPSEPYRARTAGPRLASGGWLRLFDATRR